VSSNHIAKAKQQMIRRARRRFIDIRPCATKKRLADCFTFEQGRLMFWFNTEKNSTCMLSMPMEA